MDTKIVVTGELILELTSRQDWFNRIPRALPEKRADEQWIWVDRYGNVLTVGKDFVAAEKMKSYPVKIFRLQRSSEDSRASENCCCETDLVCSLHYGKYQIPPPQLPDETESKPL